MRRLPLPFLAAAVLLLPAAARAGGEAAEAAARLQEKYSAGVDAMKPEEVDAHRAALLEPLVVSGDPVAVEVLLRVGRERVDQVNWFRERVKTLERKLEEAEEKRKEREKEGKPEEKPAPGRREESPELMRAELERIPPRIEREERWQPRLGEALGKAADALPDREFDKVAAPMLRAALGEKLAGYQDWLAEALGHSRKERTARLLLDLSAEALAEYRKALAQRVKPARELDEVNQKIYKILKDYLEDQQKKGDFSGHVPDSVLVGLIGNRRAEEKQRLEREVKVFQEQMEAADVRRRAAARGLGRMIAGADGDLRGTLLDTLEKEALGGRDFEGRAFGLGVLGPVPGDRAMKLLREAAADPVPVVVVAALEALAAREEAEAVEILAAALGDPRWQVRAAAAAGLGASGRAAAVPPLIAALGAAEGRTVDDLRAALVALTGKDFPPVAERWERWWAGAKDSFRGARDPGGGEAAKGGEGAAAGDAGAEGGPEGHRVSFYGIETRSERILFILDFSGSMLFRGSEVGFDRKKIDILYEEMRKTLAGLPDGAKFNIIGFSADVREWGTKPAVAGTKGRKEAMDWVEKQPVMGSTNIYDALERAFQRIGVGASRDRNYEPAYDTIFFMTDGTPTSGKVTDTGLILGDVRRWNEGRKVRIHVIGMGGKKADPDAPRSQRGNDLDEEFLKKLAADHGGECVIR